MNYSKDITDLIISASEVLLLFFNELFRAFYGWIEGFLQPDNVLHKKCLSADPLRQKNKQTKNKKDIT